MAVDRSKLRVLVADDHPMFRLGLALALRSLGFGQVDEAVDGRHAVELATGRRIDVVILDLRMPRLNGVDAARSISRADAHEHEAPVIVMLTTFDEPAVVAAAAEAGAVAFVGKEIEPEALARLLDDLLARRGSRMIATPELPHLTSREADVLRLLVSGMSVKEMAQTLGISPETIKVHLGRLYGKLGVNDRVAAIRAGRRLGWVVLDEIHATT
jgi:two-component system, NarL family, nitrate/nitrite response regulator NarL